MALYLGDKSASLYYANGQVSVPGVYLAGLQVFPTGPTGNTTLLLNCNGSNGSTAFTDSSPAAQAVTASGGAQISTAQSKFGGASCRFNATGDLLTASHAEALDGDFTIEMWLYSAAWSTNDNMLFEFRPSATLASWVNDGGLMYVYSPLGDFSVRATLTPGQWQHVAVVRQGTTIGVYLNGTLSSSYTDGSTFSTDGLKIGMNTDLESTPQFFVDDFRIVKGAAVYTATFTPPTSQLGVYS